MKVDSNIITRALPSLLFIVPGLALSSLRGVLKNDGAKHPFQRFLQNQQYIIPAGTDATIEDNTVSEVHIYGTLNCPVGDNTGSTVIRVHVDRFVIHDGGVFRCGDRSTNSPVTGKVDIILTGTDDDDDSRAFVVEDGGTLDIYGNTSKSLRTRLRHTAEVGSTVLVLRESVQNYWEVGDTIVVATTGFNRQPNFGQNEKVTIESISGDGHEVTITPSLEFEHFGTSGDGSSDDDLSTYYADNRFHLDESAHVFNLNRNVIIRSDNDSGPIGGHVIVHRGSNVQVEGLELVHLGQAGKMGRYPFHWHFAGNVNGQFIQKSSIYHSFQRCVVVHGTDEALVDDNTCFDFHGHGIFLEDGNELNNTIQNNLVVLAKKAIPGLELLQSEHVDADIDRFPAPSGIWVSNPSNDILRNVVISSEGTGLWMSFIKHLCCKATGGCTQYFSTEASCYSNFGSQATFMVVTKMETGRFDENVGASSVVGINWDGAALGSFVANPNNPQPSEGEVGLGDREILITHYSPPIVPTFRGNVMYKNSRRALYFRGEQAIFESNIFADNAGAPLFAFNQVLKNCLVVGWSSNSELSYFFNKIDPSERTQIKKVGAPHGLNLYDGPLVLDEVFAAGFPSIPIASDDHPSYFTKDWSPKLMKPVGASERFVNYAKGVYFLDDEKPEYLYDFNAVSILQAATLYDEGGHISGIPGATITGYEPINDDPKCNTVFAQSHAFVCTDYEVGTVTFTKTRPLLDDMMVNANIVRRNSDGVARADDPELWTMDRRHFQVISSRGTEDYRYHIKSFLGAQSPDLLTFVYRHDVNPGLSPPILMHYDEICEGTARWQIGGSVVTLATEDDLASHATEDASAVFYDDGQKIAGIRASANRDRTQLGLYPGAGARAQSSEFKLVCNGEFIPSNRLSEPKGSMSVFRLENTIRVTGMACITGYDDAARVKVVSKQGNVTLLPPTPTNQPTTNEITAKCQTLGTANHSYSFDINLPASLSDLSAIDLVLSIEGNSGPDNGTYHPIAFAHVVLDPMMTFSEYKESHQQRHNIFGH